MIIENKKATRTIRLLFNLAGFLYIILIALFYFLGNIKLVALFAALFVADLICFLGINFHYIYFTVKDNLLILRYYPVISMLGREYRSIEFPSEALHAYNYKEYLGGIYARLSLTVKTPKGMATYPTVNLSGLMPEKREQLRKQLDNLIAQNHERQPQV